MEDDDVFELREMSQTGGQSRGEESARDAAVASDVWLALCGGQFSLAMLFGTVHSYVLGHCSSTCPCDGVDKNPEYLAGRLTS